MDQGLSHNSLLFTPIPAWQQKDKLGEMVSFDWVKDENRLLQEEEIFFRSFIEAYKDLSNTELDISDNDRNRFFGSFFDDLRQRFETKKMQLLSAKKENKTIGFVGFEVCEKVPFVYIRYLVVDPSCWKLGIGKQLVLSGIKAYPGVQKLLVVTRKINHISTKFYLKLGFKQSQHGHGGVDPEKYVGFEFDITQKT